MTSVSTGRRPGRMAGQLDANGLHLAIDASNIRMGGGLTHLSQLLSAASPGESGIEHVTVWACNSTLEVLPQRPWLHARHAAWLEAPLPVRVARQQVGLPAEIVAAGCDVLFAPGGTLPARIGVPKVTMSQNLLPFEPLEAARYGAFRWMRVKMRLLREAQQRSFERADGLIFLTHYAQDVVLRALRASPGKVAVIPHGVEARFRSTPRAQRVVAPSYGGVPFRLLYVSAIEPYKQQVQVARAVAALRAEGWPVEVRFIGAATGAYRREFERHLARLDPRREFVRWAGHEPFEAVHSAYMVADAFVFASSCENLPNILLEAMSAGLPIACSSKGPMPEVVGPAGLYFDPDDLGSIVEALRQLIGSHELRAELADEASRRTGAYSWSRCASETFDFIGEVALNAPPDSGRAT